jgi:hypothetical protein
MVVPCTCIAYRACSCETAGQKKPIKCTKAVKTVEEDEPEQTWGEGIDVKTMSLIYSCQVLTQTSTPNAVKCYFAGQSSPALQIPTSSSRPAMRGTVTALAGTSIRSMHLQGLRAARCT